MVDVSHEYIHMQNYLIGLVCVVLFLQEKLMLLLNLKLTEDLKSEDTDLIQQTRCEQKYCH